MHVLGKYKLLRKLAAGGMAEVFLARVAGPEQFQKDIAIKRILAHLTDNQTFIRMFLDEARLVARLNHPNIAQVFDLGEADGQFFVAMEYVAGRNVAKVMDSCDDHRMPVALAIKVASHCCDALHYAHELTRSDGTPLNIIHRDISPQNIMLSYDGAVKVVDFGIAKAASNLHQTQVTTLKGKLSYMSPEQVAQNVTLDRRTDIFSLGVTLYAMLCGRLPFVADTGNAVMSAILHDDPPDPRTLAADVPDELCRLLDRMLKKDRKQRFANAHEVHQALERVLLARQTIVDSQTLAKFLQETLPPDAPEPSYSLSPHAAADTVISREPGEPDVEPTEAATNELTGRTAGELSAGVERAPARGRGVAIGVLMVALVSIGVGVVIGPGISRVLESAGTDKPVAADLQPVVEPVDPAPVIEPAPVDPPVEPRAIPAEPVEPRKHEGKRRAPRPGTVAITTTPVTEVTIDGRPRGRTPLGEVRLKPGTHDVELRSHESGIHFRQRIEITAGAVLTIDKSFARGSLNIFALPFGEVFVDGISRGLTPLDGPVTIYEGSHVVRVVCNRTGKEETRRVQLAANRSIRLNFDLR